MNEQVPSKEKLPDWLRRWYALKGEPRFREAADEIERLQKLVEHDDEMLRERNTRVALLESLVNRTAPEPCALLARAAEHVCSMLCPSQWETGQRPPHSRLCQEITAALAGASQPPSPEWLPIETAPSDGRYALVYRPLAERSHDNPVDIKRLIGGNSHCWECTVPPGQEPYNPTDGACHVTHWMPLPSPPTKFASPE